MGDENINFVDVGARGGSSEELSTLVENISYIGFDADKEEIIFEQKFILKKIQNTYVALLEVKKTIEFNLYKKPDFRYIFIKMNTLDGFKTTMII